MRVAPPFQCQLQAWLNSPAGVVDQKKQGRMAHKTGNFNKKGQVIEILVALAVLGTAIFILLDTHYTALRLHESMSEEVAMRQLVETVIAKAEVDVLAGNLSDAGDFGQRYPDYTWSFDAALGGDLEFILLYTVNVSIKGPTEERDLQFYLYDTGREEAEETGTKSR